MSRPAPARTLNSRWAALTTSLSALLVSLRSNGPIFGRTALILSLITLAPLAVSAHFAAKVIQFGIEPRQQFAGARRPDHIDRAVDRLLRQQRVELDLEVK